MNHKCKISRMKNCSHKYKSIKIITGLDLDDAWTPGQQGISLPCHPDIYTQLQCELCGKKKYTRYKYNSSDLSNILLKNFRPNMSEYTKDYANSVKDCNWHLDDGADGHGKVDDDNKYWSFRARCSDCGEVTWLDYKINDLLKLLQKKSKGKSRGLI